MNKPPEFRFIDEQEYDSIADRPHNPPSIGPRLTAVMFAQEWQDARDKLERTLLTFCRRHDCAAEDFLVVADRSPTRGLSFAVLRERVLKPELIETVRMCLKSLDQDYAVFFGPDWTTKRTEMRHHDFGLIVYKNQVLGRFCHRKWVHGVSQTKNREAARLLGFGEPPAD